MTTQPPKKITLKQFIRLFGETESRKYCFILGAGASKTSGIPTGAEMAKEWLKEIKEDLSKDECDAWLKYEGIDANSCAEYYPQIFAKRFEVDKQAGYDYLQNQMEKAKPSCGYLFLAEILAQGQHDVVITTNFDSLTEDALFTFTSQKPLVIGHSSLADFIGVNLRRPQVIKVHHDLLLSPKNTEPETKAIGGKMVEKLQEIFTAYTPIVIGYGGNDDGFVDTLEEYLNKRLYWCFLESSPPSAKIQQLVAKNDGRLVPIPGFDELMVLLGEHLGMTPRDKRMEEVAQKHVKTSRARIEQVNKGISTDVSRQPSIVEVPSEIQNNTLRETLLRGISERKETWWNYEILAQQESDPDKKARLYQQGLKHFPKSHELMGHYADFLTSIKQDHDEAESYYKQALELAPDNAAINADYASFLTDIKQSHDQAEHHHKRALSLAPDSAVINANYANFLTYIKRNHNQAEWHYKHALKLAPDNVDFNANYANFLTYVKRNHNQAEWHYKHALKLAPDNAIFNANYAIFLKDIKRDHAQAEVHYKRALELAPDNADFNANYAGFLADIKQSHDQAESYFKRALALAPDSANFNANYAVFLNGIKKYQQAERYFKQSLKLAPNDANYNANYALYLLEQGRMPEARDHIDKAFEFCDPSLSGEVAKLELWFYRFACFYDDYPDSPTEVAKLLKAGICSPRWNLQGLVDKAKENQHPQYKKVAEFARKISAVKKVSK